MAASESVVTQVTTWLTGAAVCGRHPASWEKLEGIAPAWVKLQIQPPKYSLYWRCVALYHCKMGNDLLWFDLRFFDKDFLCLLELTGRLWAFVVSDPLFRSSQFWNKSLLLPHSPVLSFISYPTNTASDVSCLPALVCGQVLPAYADGHWANYFQILWFTSWSCQANASRLPIDCGNIEPLLWNTDLFPALKLCNQSSLCSPKLPDVNSWTLNRAWALKICFSIWFPSFPEIL